MEKRFLGGVPRDAWLWRHKAKRVEITIVDATVSKPGGFQISIEDSQRLLARRQPWAGVVIAIVIAAPNLLWQAANGWPFVAHIAILAAEKNIPLSPFSFLLQEILALGPASAPVWLAGLAAFGSACVRVLTNMRPTISSSETGKGGAPFRPMTNVLPSTAITRPV